MLNMSKNGSATISLNFAHAARSNNNNTHRRSPLSSHLGKRSRQRFQEESDSSDNDGDSRNGRDESITHLGENSASHETEERARNGRRRQDQVLRPAKDGRSVERRAERAVSQDAASKPEDAIEEPMHYGLNAFGIKDTNGQHKTEGTGRDNKSGTDEDDDESHFNSQEPSTSVGLRITEEQAFRRNIARDAPDADNTDSYTANPVEGFGASLLAGQGWDGKMRGPKVRTGSRLLGGYDPGGKKLKAEEEAKRGDKGKGDKRPRLDEYRRSKDRERDRQRDREDDDPRDRRDRYRDKDRERDSHRNRHRERDGRRDGDRRDHRHPDDRRRDDYDR